MTIKEIKTYIVSILIGAAILCVFSTFQKIAMNYPLYPSGYILPFIAGGFGGFLYALRWVQEQKHYKKIEMHNKKLTTILETVQSGIVLVDADTSIIEYVNPMAENILDYNSSKIIGKKCYNYLCSESPETCKILNQKDKEEYIQKSTIRVNDKNVPVIRKARNVNIENRTIIIISMMDVSSILEIEEKLRQANERVRIANRLKTEFLTNVGHEIRTPLNAIIGISDLLIYSPNFSEDIIEDLNLIKNSGKSLLRTMENIIDYAMLKSGNIVLKAEPFDFYESIAYAASLFQNKAIEKGLKFEINIDNCIGKEIVGQKTAFEKIFYNMFDNAIKFTKNGGITIDCQETKINETEFLLIKISDTGIGIPENQWEYIFDAFYQVDGKLTRSAEGTGMGLAIVDYYIKIMGGSIDVKSEVGTGTTFSLKIPKVLTNPLLTDI